MTLWTPLEWFLRLLNMVGSIEFFPGITLFGVSLALLTIVLIFRMIIFPLSGGSVNSLFGRSKSDRGAK